MTAKHQERKTCGAWEVAARVTSMVLRPEGRVRESRILLERGRTWVGEWAERWREARGADKVQRHTETEVSTCGGGEGIDTEAKERRDSVDRGGHKVEHDWAWGRVGGRRGGSGTQLRIVGEDATATEEREEGDQEGAGGGVGERDMKGLMNKGKRKKKRVSFRVLPPALLGTGQGKPPSVQTGEEEKEKETGNFKEFTKYEAAPVKIRMDEGKGSGRSRGAVGESGRGGDQGMREGGREWGDGEEGRGEERGRMPGISRGGGRGSGGPL
jgi:hypothetical protein